MSAYPFKLDDSYPISPGFPRCRARRDAAAPLNTTIKSRRLTRSPRRQQACYGHISALTPVADIDLAAYSSAAARL